VNLLRPRIFFDVSGLVQWYAYLRHPSGVQRFCERILQSRVIRSSSEVILMARAPGGEAFHQVDYDVIIDLADPDRRDRAISHMRQQFAAMLRLSRPSLLRQDLRIVHLPYLAMGWARPWLRAPEIVGPLQCGEAVVGLGDFWCHPGHVAALLRMKGRASLIHMVHDLLVLNHPEWSHPYFGALVGRTLTTLAPHVDRWLVASHFVTGQLKRFLAARQSPIDLIPMGADGFAPEEPSVLARHGLVAGEYILHVGTLEPRKNLVALIDAVERIPKAWPLVLVGRDGWHSHEVHRRLRRAGKRVAYWIPDAADSELTSLYRGARFTVVASLGEGWGLPVQESLAHGIPCIASKAGALPEAGGTLVRYVQPGDIDALAEAIADWSENSSALGAAKSAITRCFQRQPSSWEDTAAAVLKSVMSVRSSASV
jgi:glycosyltransferase involved in cell wall biosynthesis